MELMWVYIFFFIILGLEFILNNSYGWAEFIFAVAFMTSIVTFFLFIFAYSERQDMTLENKNNTKGEFNRCFLMFMIPFIITCFSWPENKTSNNRELYYKYKNYKKKKHNSYTYREGKINYNSININKYENNYNNHGLNESNLYLGNKNIEIKSNDDDIYINKYEKDYKVNQGSLGIDNNDLEIESNYNDISIKIYGEDYDYNNQRVSESLIILDNDEYLLIFSFLDMKKVYLKKGTFESFYDSEKNRLNMYTFKFSEKENDESIYKIAIKIKDCKKYSGYLFIYDINSRYITHKTFIMENKEDVNSVISQYTCGLLKPN